MKWIFWSFMLVYLWSGLTQAATSDYIQNVEAERQEHFYEIFLFAEPPPRVRPISDVIFNRQLSAEFRTKYRDTFGTIDTESIIYQRSDYSRLEVFTNRKSSEDANQVRKTFAEYMMRRLFEWHVDNYVNSEPAMRPVVDMKKKLEKVEVRVNKETKLQLKYSFAANLAEFVLDNPYCESKWGMQMDPKAIGPGKVLNNTLTLGKTLSTKTRVEGYWTDYDTRVRFQFIKWHTGNFGSSYGVSGAYKRNDYYGTETRYTAGLGYSF